MCALEITIQLCAFTALTYSRLPALPFTPGNDCVGIVEASNSNNHKINDVCLIADPTTKLEPGAYSQFVQVGADGCINLGKKDDFPEVELSNFAAFGVPFFTAYRALVLKARFEQKAQVNILVHGGSGAVGLMTIQLARFLNKNCKITATASSNDGKLACLESGADYAIDHQLDKSNHRKFDIIIEMLADHNLSDCMKCVCKNGKIIVVGSRGDVNVTPRDIMIRAVAKNQKKSCSNDVFSFSLRKHSKSRKYSFLLYQFLFQITHLFQITQ